LFSFLRKGEHSLSGRSKADGPAIQLATVHYLFNKASSPLCNEVGALQYENINVMWPFFAIRKVCFFPLLVNLKVALLC